MISAKASVRLARSTSETRPPKASAISSAVTETNAATSGSSASVSAASPRSVAPNSTTFSSAIPASQSSPSAPHGATPPTVAAEATRSGSSAAQARACGPPAGGSDDEQGLELERLARRSRRPRLRRRPICRGGGSSRRSPAWSTSRSRRPLRLPQRARRPTGGPMTACRGSSGARSDPARGTPTPRGSVRPASPPHGVAGASSRWYGRGAAVRYNPPPMSTDRVTLEVSTRAADQLGSRNVRRLRSQGLIPGVLYGKQSGSFAFVVAERDLRTALGGASGVHTVVDVVLDGTSRSAVVKDFQRHPVRGTLTHIDFHEVRLDVAIQVTVQVVLVGESPGARQGGLVQPLVREVRVEALPTAIPEHIEVSIETARARRARPARRRDGLAGRHDPRRPRDGGRIVRRAARRRGDRGRGARRGRGCSG